MLPMLAAAAVSAGIGAASDAGLFGKPKQYGFTKEDIQRSIAARGAEIDTFSRELAQMRSQYLAQIPGLQEAAFKRFGGDAAAQLGAKGMGVDSGAFASALARAAIPMQADMYGKAFDTGTDNLKTVDTARGSLFSSGVAAMAGNTSTPTPNPVGAALGRFAGQAGMMALSQGLTPAGTVATPAGASMGNMGLPPRPMTTQAGMIAQDWK